MASYCLLKLPKENIREQTDFHCNIGKLTNLLHKTRLFNFVCKHIDLEMTIIPSQAMPVIYILKGLLFRN